MPSRCCREGACILAEASIWVGLSVSYTHLDVYKRQALDWLITAFDQVVMSIPSFFIGILACFLFGIVFRLFTPGNFVSYTQDWGACIAYLLFPALSIAIPRIAMTVKMLRGAILNELGQDYVRTAQSRGNSRRAILQRLSLIHI